MKKLFYEDIHMIDFKATVTECNYIETKKVYEVVLDQTAFFPEEGGQVADRGTLARQAVQDVRIKNDIIYHLLASPIAIGETVIGHVDWSQRFDFMQQHSGEHIISGLIHKHYGLQNVGFHLGLQEVTLDFNGELSWEQLREIEQEANDAVWQNLPVEITFPSSAELTQLEYRSKLNLTENVRIVTIPGYDTCACCAPHVETTGQIGLIKITNVQNHRGGIRVNILCGKRAVADYTEKQDSISAISVQLSAKQTAVTDAVDRLKGENLRLRELCNSLQANLIAHSVSSLPSPKESAHAVLFADIMNEIALRNAVNELTLQYAGYCAAFAGNDTDGYRFIIGSANLDCRELANRLRSCFQAKGGGTAPMIQGTIMAERNELETFMASL